MSDIVKKLTSRPSNINLFPIPYTTTQLQNLQQTGGFVDALSAKKRQNLRKTAFEPLDKRITELKQLMRTWLN